jgi:hypothetical protein
VVTKTALLVLIIFSLPGCATPLQPISRELIVTPPVDPTNPAEPDSVWSVYDPDPDHLWNRVFRQLYRRTSVGGEEYGAAELDPLLWLDTTHLLNGSSHEHAVQVLDEFLNSHAENLIGDPLRRAMFQRDLWAVFDWVASQAQPYPVQRKALKTCLAQIIKRVALSKDSIRSLPDNYALAIESGIYPSEYQADAREVAFLPADLLQPESGWIPMGREGGPAAMTHTESFPFFGRSVFLVFVRSPEGRQATLDFIESLNREPNPVTAVGSKVALVRRMLLIDDQGEIILSPLVETVQLRHFSPAQNFYEFELNRAELFDGRRGGLIPKADIFMLFMGHGDVFENPAPELQASIPRICAACHFEYPPIPNSGNTKSIISYSRQPFSLANHQEPVLLVTTVIEEAQTVIVWKRRHATWQSLAALWNQKGP